MSNRQYRDALARAVRRKLTAEQRSRHVSMLTDVRDRLLARVLAVPTESRVVLCRLHNRPWQACTGCSKISH